jgi:hypothetical protein
VATLETLKTRIAGELNRSDLTSEIASAISTAIRFYRSKRFEFNEQVASFNTTDGQQAYTTATIPDDIGAIDLLMITVSGRVYELTPTDYQELKNLTSTTSLEGSPERFAFYAQQIFLYPIPDATYSVSISYQQRKDEPANDSDGATVWTNEAEPLIRACAKKIVARDKMWDNELEARCERAEMEAYAMLAGESMQLQDEGGLTANW